MKTVGFGREGQPVAHFQNFVTHQVVIYWQNLKYLFFQVFLDNLPYNMIHLNTHYTDTPQQMPAEALSLAQCEGDKKTLHRIAHRMNLSAGMRLVPATIHPSAGPSIQCHADLLSTPRMQGSSNGNVSHVGCPYPTPTQPFTSTGWERSSRRTRLHKTRSGSKKQKRRKKRPKNDKVCVPIFSKITLPSKITLSIT